MGAAWQSWKNARSDSGSSGGSGRSLSASPISRVFDKAERDAFSLPVASGGFSVRERWADTAYKGQYFSM